MTGHPAVFEYQVFKHISTLRAGLGRVLGINQNNHPPSCTQRVPGFGVELCNKVVPSRIGYPLGVALCQVPILYHVGNAQIFKHNSIILLDQAMHHL